MYLHVAVLSQFTAIHYCHETKQYEGKLNHTAIWYSWKQFNMKQWYDPLISLDVYKLFHKLTEGTGTKDMHLC
jgi:hypothetical protein